MAEQLSKSLDETSVRLKEQQDWLAKYLKKSKMGRKSMFYGKMTLFGMPVN